MTDQNKAQCDECQGLFEKSQLHVFVVDAIFNCHPCILKNLGRTQALTNIALTWEELNALHEFLNGSVDVDVLLAIDDVKDVVAHRIMDILRKATKRDGIR